MPISLYWAMNSPSAGSIWMSSTASTNDRRPRKRNRLIASAARNANARQKTTVISATATLIPSAGKNVPPSTTALKLSNEPPNGSQVGVVFCRVTFGSSDEFTIQ